MSHAHEHTQRTHQQRTVVQLAREDVELAADHLVVDAVVTRDAHLVYGEGLALEYLDLEVDRVLAHDDLRRLDLRHEVTVVLVEVCH